MVRTKHRAPFLVRVYLTAQVLTALVLAGCGRGSAVPGPDRVAHAGTLVADRPLSHNAAKPQPGDRGAEPPPTRTSEAGEDLGRRGLRPPIPETRSSIRFRDVSDTTGIAFTHNSGNSPEKYYPTGLGSGVSMIDYDRDGWLDLYFCTTRNLPLDAPTTSKGNKLYRNKGDGTFEDVTERAGVGYNGFCHSAAVADVDNNGFADLYLCNYGSNVLYLNQGDGTFRPARNFGAECRSWSTTAAFFDYDNDGWLDLYVSCYGHWQFDEPHQFCGDETKKARVYCPPSMIPPDHHFLFHNQGDGTFKDVTALAGVMRRDGRGMGVIAADVNRDGKLDLYVANDMCPHFLFLNKGDGTFDDVTNWSGAAVTESGHYQGGMGVDIEDLDEDGYPELFVTNFDGEYNTIHQTTDGKNFEDVSAVAGIVKDSIPDVGWGCALADLDNDGWPDMLVVNGHVDDNLKQLGRQGDYEQRVKIWRNRGRCRFHLVPDAGPFFAVGHASRGAAFGDLDNDGDIDVVINRMDSRPAVLLNESDRGHWIRLELSGTKSNWSAIGTAVELHMGGRVMRRQLKGGGSYASANDPRLLIGVGKVEKIDRIEIRWPSGRRTTLADPKLGQTHRVIEPAGAAAADGAQSASEGLSP